MYLSNFFFLISILFVSIRYFFLFMERLTTEEEGKCIAFDCQNQGTIRYGVQYYCNPCLAKKVFSRYYTQKQINK